MADYLRQYTDFLMLGGIPILIKETGLPIYDFRFREVFECKSIIHSPERPVLLRIGAIDNFIRISNELQSLGIDLLFTEEEHDRASLLENWYPLLAKYTPFSRVYDGLPPIDVFLQEFRFPVFIKGNRQTNHHKKSQCIIENLTMYESLASQWENDKYLHWQKAVVREYMPLEKIGNTQHWDMIPASYEFRVFFWKKNLVGYGKYWSMEYDYALKAHDKGIALDLAHQAATIVDVPFLAVDVAKTQCGKWIIIEINDGQESGYVGVDRTSLWQNILSVEEGKTVTL